MSKTLRIDFFKVVAPFDFAAALRRIWGLPSEEVRVFETKDGPVRLRRLEETDGFLLGDMMRIRLGEPTFLAKTSGGERPVSQDDDEGLGETNAFLYCPATKYVAYQRNRNGVPAYKTAFYVQQKIQAEQAVNFEPVLAPVAVNQLLGGGSPRKLRFRVVASALDPQSVDNASLSEVLDAARRMESPEMEITFSMGRKRSGGLSKSDVVDWVRKALSVREQGHDVKALEVSVPGENGEKTEVLDFIDATLKATYEVEPTQLHEEFFRRRMQLVREAWETHRKDLR